MHKMINQLEGVRRKGLILLLMQRWQLWLSVVLAMMLFCAAIDYLVPLPAWLRLIIGMALAILASVWLFSRTVEVLGFDPDLSVLALRLERLYPHLAGVLASGVELAGDPQRYAQTPRSAQLAQASIAQAERKMADLPVNRLLDTTSTWRTGMVALFSLAIFIAAGFVAGPNSALAARRWFEPLGQTQWPRHTHIKSQIDNGLVRPADKDVQLTAQVLRGSKSTVEVFVHYRIKMAGRIGDWQRVAMNPQFDSRTGQRTGDFDRSIRIRHLISQDSLTEMQAGHLEFFFTGDDDTTEPQELTLVPRPRVRSVEAIVTPPAYAMGLIPPRQIRMTADSPDSLKVSALQGSKVILEIRLNKPIRFAIGDSKNDWSALLPRFPDAQHWFASTDAAPNPPELTPAPVLTLIPIEDGRSDNSTVYADTLRFEFTLDRNVGSSINLVDEFGIGSLSEHLYQFESVEDQLPSTTIREPRADEAVLAQALLNLGAAGRDDVALDWLGLRYRILRHRSGERPIQDKTQDKTRSKTESLPGQVLPQVHASDPSNELAQVSGPQSRLKLTQSLDLSKLKLAVGDEVLIISAAKDVFSLKGLDHDLVLSEPRRLRIVDQTTLMTLIRKQLTTVRHQALRLDARQGEILRSSEPVESDQKRLSASLDRQTKVLAQLKARVNRNRLQIDSLAQLIDQAMELFAQAHRGSGNASRIMGELKSSKQEPSQLEQQHKDAAREQAKVHLALSNVVKLLDQGRDALATQLQLAELKSKQQYLIDQSSRLMARTVGKNPDSLAPKTRRELEDLATRQSELADSTEKLLQRMQVTAQTITRQAKRPGEHATAQAMKDAVRIAQQLGLKQNMDDASAKLEQNQMADAGRHQRESLSTIELMLKQLQEHDNLRKEKLMRFIAGLEKSISQLVEQQKRQLAMLSDARVTAPSLEPQELLRRNTLSVQAQAALVNETKPVAIILGRAVVTQGQVVSALRSEQRPEALEGQRRALNFLEAALQQIKLLGRKEQSQSVNKDRQELRKKYLSLIEQQNALLRDTSQFEGIERLTRRYRAKLVDLSDQQEEIRLNVAKLGQSVEESPVLKMQHQHINTLAEAIVGQLGQSQAFPDIPVVLDEQTQIAQRLAIIAQSLEQTADKEDFWGTEAESGGSEAEATSGGRSRMPLVPPLAELKALRGVQQFIYDRTKALEAQLESGQNPQAPQNPRSARSQAKLKALADEQRELFRHGERLIRKLQQQTQSQDASPPVQ